MSRRTIMGIPEDVWNRFLSEIFLADIIWNVALEATSWVTESNFLLSPLTKSETPWMWQELCDGKLPVSLAWLPEGKALAGSQPRLNLLKIATER